MYIQSSNPQEITDYILSLQPSAQDLVLIMVGEAEATNLHELVACLNEYHLNFVGGVFPGLLVGKQRYEHGVLIKILPALPELMVIKELNQDHFQIPSPASLDLDTSHCSAVVLLDGLTSGISLFLSRLYHRLGDKINYIGGGAGSLSLIQKPCVFCREGVFQDAAIVAFVKMKSKLAVKHGWVPIGGPFLVTSADRNQVKEINWENAYQVYKEQIEAHSGEVFNTEDFFAVAKAYPFGITKKGAEPVVRDPITVSEKGEIICVGEIPENTALMLLKGYKQNLIEAAREAAQSCTAIPRAEQIEALCFDCISRVLFLENDFQEELKAVVDTFQQKYKELLPTGALTLGEISSYGEGYIEFFNKTMVVSMLYR